QDAVIELQTHGSRVSSMTNSSGLAYFKNLPFTKYSFKAFLYGFKVAEGEVEVELDEEMIEIVAPGILDLRLSIVDGDRQPLDSGEIKLSIGDRELDARIDVNGFARVRELPNSTIYIEEFYYKGIKVEVDPSEINLVRDEMLIVVSARVYTLQGSIVLKDERPMDFGQVIIYVDGEKISTIDLSDGNTFIERLPSGELNVDVIFKMSKVGSRTLTLDSSKQISIIADVYMITITFYDTLGKPIEGLKLELKSDKGLVEELESDSEGLIESFLPSGSYLLKIDYEDNSYTSSILLKDNTKLNFIVPVEFFNPIIIFLIPLANIAIVSFRLLKMVNIRKAKVKKVRKKLPRV
ncbi:MAG: hypothetical protein ABDH32_07860, partial [Candidatus Caldarchaeales archaeon]